MGPSVAVDPYTVQSAENARSFNFPPLYSVQVDGYSTTLFAQSYNVIIKLVTYLKSAYAWLPVKQ